MKQKIPGQSLTEYSLIMGLVAMLCVPALLLLKDSVNSSIADMLPSSKTNTPNVVKPPQNGNPPNSDPETNAGGGVGNITVIGAGAHILPVSTAGANGNSATVLANSLQMQAIAAKYSQTSPELSNAIIKLGQLGQQMGQAMANNDKLAANQIWSNFSDLFTEIQMRPGVYAQLNPADQALIKTLTNQSSQLAADFSGVAYTGLPGLDDYNGVSSQTDGTDTAAQVQSNSNQTVQCGQNLKCN